MRIWSCCSVAFLVLAICGTATAGEYNEKLSIGSPAPAWVDLPGVDGKKHSLADIKDDVVIVVFTCNSCPVAGAYEGRLAKLSKDYAGKAAVVAINVNTVEEDSLPKMKERAKAQGYDYQYLYDETQKIGREFGALFTPEFFVLDKDRKIAYMGRMDDNTEEDMAKTNFVEQTVAALLKGEKVSTKETRGVGCRIRYARERRPKKD